MCFLCVFKKIKCVHNPNYYNTKFKKPLVIFDADDKLSERCSLLQPPGNNLKVTKSRVNLATVLKLKKRA